MELSAESVRLERKPILPNIFIKNDVIENSPHLPFKGWDLLLQTSFILQAEESVCLHAGFIFH